MTTSAAKRTRLPSRSIFVAGFVLAVVVRLLHAFEAGEHVATFETLIADADVYWSWASRVLAGDWLGSEVFYMAPLYPYVLALVRAVVGDDLWLVRCIQAAIGGVTVVLLMASAGQLVRNFSGALLVSRHAFIVVASTGLMAAMYAPLVYWDELIGKSVLDNLFVAGLCWLLIGGAIEREALSLRRAVAIGWVSACLCLTRENALLLLPVLVLVLAWYALRRRPNVGLAKAAAPLMAFVFAVAMVLVPVGIRNWAIGGDFALTTSQAGPNFYMGNRLGASGKYEPLRAGRGHPAYERRDATTMAAKDLGHLPSPNEVTRYWLRRTWVDIQSDPSAFLRLLMTKCRLMLSIYEVPDTEDQYYYEDRTLLLGGLGRLFNFALIFPLAVMGVVFLFQQRRLPWVVLLWGSIYGSSVVLFMVLARFRLPLAVLALPFAALGGVEGVLRIVARERARATSALVLGALALALTLDAPAARDAHLPIDLINEAMALRARGNTGDLEQAEALDREAMRLAPQLMNARQGLAMDLLAQQRNDEAQDILLTMEQGGGDDVQAHTFLAAAFRALHDPVRAQQHADAARQLYPDDAAPLAIAAELAMDRGDVDAAFAALAASVAADDTDPKTLTQLALWRATTPYRRHRDAQAARVYAASAVRRTAARDGRALDALALAHAGCGDLHAAVAVAQQAIDALTARRDPFADEVRRRLSAYQADKAPPAATID